MPELPEVEHNRKNLARWLGKGPIVHAETTDARIVENTPGAFAHLLARRKVLKVERRGKWLRIRLAGGFSLFAHLGMTGWFRKAKKDDPPLRFERARLDVARTSIRYTDPRRWGRLVVTKEELPAWTALGPDPLSDGIDAKALAARLARRKKRSVKEVLMDQTVLAGVGNIQAIEALWKAKIDPRSRASALDAAHVAAVVRGLRWTIERTLADLAKDEEGTDNPFVIYGRKDTPCPRCRTTLHRIELGGRTTTFCPGCQQRLR